MANIDLLGKQFLSNHKLKLSDGGRTEISPNSTPCEITWKTVNLKKVKKFRLEGKQDNSPIDGNITQEMLPELKLKFKQTSSSFDWDYSIIWIDEHDIERRHDPKIAINPSFNILAQIIKTLICGIIGFFSLRYVIKQFNRK